MNEVRQPMFWGAQDEERLTHKEMDDAIESILDDAETLDGVITVCGYVTLELPPAEEIATNLLDDILESYGGDYGDPEGSIADDETPLMRKAAEVFAAVFRQEYSVWACRVAETHTIDVREWVKEHRPDWLAEEDEFEDRYDT